MTHVRPYPCIVPPQVLEKLLEHKSRKVRDSALETLMVSERIRERRSLRAVTAKAAASGALERRIYDAGTGSDLPGRLVRGELVPATADPSVNEAFDGLGDTYRFFKDVLKRNSIDGNGMVLEGTVHFGDGYQNAFWDGARMVFGDGDGRIFVSFTKSKDVIAHELAHGVTEHTADLAYHNQPGALNESFSDVFGSLVKQYALNQTADQADWLIGKDIVGKDFPGRALRSMKDPGTAYDGDDQPGHMRNYVDLPDTRAGDWGGVHVNSGIPNRAFHLFATALGGRAWETAGRVWYATLLELRSDSKFQVCADKSVLVAKREFGADTCDALIDAWAKVGITTKVESDRKPPEKRGGGDLEAQLERLEKEIERALTLLRNR